MTPLEQLALVPKILEAAELLHKAGVLEHDPAFYVKKYVDATPEINQFLKDHTGDSYEKDH